MRIELTEDEFAGLGIFRDSNSNEGDGFTCQRENGSADSGLLLEGDGQGTLVKEGVGSGPFEEETPPCSGRGDADGYGNYLGLGDGGVSSFMSMKDLDRHKRHDDLLYLLCVMAEYKKSLTEGQTKDFHSGGCELGREALGCEPPSLISLGFDDEGLSAEGEGFGEGAGGGEQHECMMDAGGAAYGSGGTYGRDGVDSEKIWTRG